MRARRRQHGLFIGLVALALVSTLAGGAAPAQSKQEQSLLGQLVSRASAIEAAQASAAAPSAVLRPSMALPLGQGTGGPGAVPAAVASSTRQLEVAPTSGPPGSTVTVVASGFRPGERLRAGFGSLSIGGDVVADASGSLRAELTVPAHAPAGALALSLASLDALGLAQPAADAAPQALFTVTGATTEPVNAPQAPIGAPAIPHFPGVPSAPPAGALQAVAAAPQQAVKPWTLAVYMTADDQQANDSTNDIDEMLRALASPSVNNNVHVVVLVDQRQGPTTYYQLSDRPAAAPVNVTPANLQGQNLDTGSPQAFVDFMAFIAQHYPANRYAVSLWSHGAGWEGIQFDETSGNDWSMAELRDALSRGLEQLGRARYDLLMFDACYMGGFEVLTEIREAVDVVVAAPGLMPKQGLPYDRVLELLGQPALTPAEIAGRIVARTGEVYSNRSTYAVSAFTIGPAFDRLTQTLDRATAELLRLAARQGGDIIQTARVNSTNYFNRFVDIGDFAAKMRVSAGLDTPSVQQTADEVIAALVPGAGFVLATVHSPSSEPGYGLTAYFPEDGRGRSVGSRMLASVAPVDDRYRELRVRSSGWYRLLTALSTGEFPHQAPPTDVPDEPVPPPASAAPGHDLIFAQVLTSQRVDLFRTSSQGGDAPLALLDDGFFNFYPRWSPDGRQVVYISDRGVSQVGGVSIGRNLFLINSDGSYPGDGPRQLTSVGVNCPSGPLQGTPCTVEQVGHPGWLTDGSGLLYTLYSYDYSSLPVRWRSTIRLVSPDGAINFELLPALAGPNSLAPYMRFDTADLKAQSGNLEYLMFSYSVTPEDASQHNFNPNFAANTIGLFDFTNRDGDGILSGTDIWGFFLHTASEFQAGNWLHTGLPAWRPGTNEVAFLYNRIGTPRIFYSPNQLDGRPPLPAGVPDRRNLLYPALGPAVFSTFDIGRMTVVPGATPGSGFSYIMRYPYWAFMFSSLGVGVNFRPSWKPDGSNNLALSLSTSLGFAWDAAVFASDSDSDGADDTVLQLTNNGASVTPSWGQVRPEDVRQRLAVSPSYLAPGATAAYFLYGSGFAPGEQVVLKASGQVIGQATADAHGRFEARLLLPQASPGLLRFSAESLAALRGPAAARVSNTAEMVVLGERGVHLPLLGR